MTNLRPEGWNNPYIESHHMMVGEDRYKIPVYTAPEKADIFEAGADAVLEELSKLKGIEIIHIMDELRIRRLKAQG